MGYRDGERVACHPGKFKKDATISATSKTLSETAFSMLEHLQQKRLRSLAMECQEEHRGRAISVRLEKAAVTIVHIGVSVDLMQKFRDIIIMS